MVIRSRIWSKALLAIIFFAAGCFMSGWESALFGAAGGALAVRAALDFRKWNPPEKKG